MKTRITRFLETMATMSLVCARADRAKMKANSTTIATNVKASVPVSGTTAARTASIVENTTFRETQVLIVRARNDFVAGATAVAIATDMMMVMLETVQ